MSGGGSGLSPDGTEGVRGVQPSFSYVSVTG